MWQTSATITATLFETLQVAAPQLSTRNMFQCNCIAASALCSGALQLVYYQVSCMGKEKPIVID